MGGLAGAMYMYSLIGRKRGRPLLTELRDGARHKEHFKNVAQHRRQGTAILETTAQESALAIPRGITRHSTTRNTHFVRLPPFRPFTTTKSVEDERRNAKKTRCVAADQLPTSCHPQCGSRTHHDRRCNLWTDILRPNTLVEEARIAHHRRVKLE